MLAAEARSALGARATYRQLVDLIARGRAPADDTLLTRLIQLRERVPEAVRIACARGLALVDAPLALVTLFATDTAEVAAATLRAVRLDAAEWETLLPRLGPVGRSVVRQRRDLPPSVERALDSFGGSDLRLSYTPASAPVPIAGPGVRFDIADLVERIGAHQRKGGDPIRPLASFQFETDAAGVIRWLDAAPRGAVIGLTLDPRAGIWAGAAVDGVASGAFRKRAPFAGARLRVPGESAIAGEWRIAGVPMFDQATGGFTGMRGEARRPRADERAERGVERDRAAGAEGLRRLVHELRTPTSAIAGFSELIEQQLLGPVAPTYRERAGDIRRRVSDLIGAIEDLDLAARIDGHALERRDGVTPACALLEQIADDLAPLAALRGAALALPAVRDAAWSVNPHDAERLIARLLSTALSAAAPGEQLSMALVGGVGTLALALVPPAALAHRDEASLYALDDEDASRDEGAPLLGVGFAFRLVRNLAAEMGGRFVIAPALLTLLLPAVEDDASGHATGGAT
ncbi:histidine kinase dimerization/phospho-acceptor domain-containing protein [Sphingomonas sp. 8AM]|uniref:histidine kinase dimerization/phospho-acceptor domain-containing protein n=1 Tax=Sphingomonas sp. 8AM TaxID=2653170 RepID=UPI001F31828B|nr:histidine kinase dimerization/phospho-acceptor domain-containing protein [Sphingomonas sp. 8AM]